MQAWFIVALAAFAACGSEEAAPTTTESHPACVPRPRICGLAPPQRATSYKVTTVTGESLWVTLPAELAHGSSVVAVPAAPLRLNASLTTAAPRDAADRFCDQFPACEPTAVSRERAPLPLVRCADAGPDLELHEPETAVGGTWCVGRRYRVDVTFADRPTLEQLHEKLTIVPG